MRKIYICILLLICFFQKNLKTSDLVKMIISEEITNLRQYPNDPAPKNIIGSPAFSEEIGKQNSQLLFGEYILANKKTLNSDWIKVSAIEQEVFQDDKWTGYSGYIKKEHAIRVKEFPKYNVVIKNIKANIYKEAKLASHKIHKLSIGTKLEVTHTKFNKNWYKVTLPGNSSGFIQKNDLFFLKKTRKKTETQLRSSIINQAIKFLDSPYVWSGRSGYDKTRKDCITSVDCSGLVNLVYRSCGIKVPRNAHDQFLKSKKVENGSDLKPGDLIFLANPLTMRINHVLIYLENNFTIESDGIMGSVRIDRLKDPNLTVIKKTCAKEYFGKPLKCLSSKSVIKDGRIIFFGSYLKP